MTSEPEYMTWLQAWAAMESLAVSANIDWFSTAKNHMGQVQMLESMAMEAFVNEYTGSDVETIRKCMIFLRANGFLG